MMAEREGSDFVFSIIISEFNKFEFPSRSLLLPLCNCRRIEENNL